MVLYVAIIAIVNVCIGVALGYLLPPFVRNESYEVDDSTRDEAEGKSERDYETTSADTAVETPSGSEVEPITDGNASNSVSGPESVGRHDLRESWTGYAEQLRDIGQRAQYCRSSQDKNLGRQVAVQLQNIIDNWYVELQRMLDAPEEVTSAGMDMTAVEMFSAQVETSLSNIKAIDWSLKFEEVLAQLENEITLLHEQQRTVLPPAARVRAASV